MQQPNQDTSILLCTLNSRYIHCAFGLRYLLANMGELKPKTKILEFTISQDSRRIAEEILSHSPTIVGFGVYIWNTTETQEVVAILKKINPKLILVLGGPEVSYEAENQPLCKLADYVVQGEGDFQFPTLCKQILEGQPPIDKWVRAQLPDILSIKPPYCEYTDADIKNRVIYVEASRGCPYKCEYCLSSLDKSVRNFNLDLFLSEMDQLINRGAKQFKFVDRTFNLSISFSTRILEFFLARMHHGLFLHFELVPDRLPEELKKLIVQFPKGTLQFEIGIQTFDPHVSQNISRKNDFKKVQQNFKFLRESTGVHTHADLIVGLPGETIETFAAGFDQLVEYDPDEVQVGILKRLKGTPVIRHDQEHEMKYQDHPPFQILSTKTMPFSTIQIMVRFAKYWDLIANSGNYTTLMRFFKLKKAIDQKSFFHWFLDLTHYLDTRHAESHSIALLNLTESLYLFLIEFESLPITKARELLIQDYSVLGRRDIPRFLKSNETILVHDKKVQSTKLPPRQSRHHQ